MPAEELVVLTPNMLNSRADRNEVTFNTKFFTSNEGITDVTDDSPLLDDLPRVLLFPAAKPFKFSWQQCFCFKGVHSW